MTAAFAPSGALGMLTLRHGKFRDRAACAEPTSATVISRRRSRALVSTMATSAAPAPGGARQKIHVAIPSKRDMFEGTRLLLEEIGSDVVNKNPQQYVAFMRGRGAELWLQLRPDIVRKVRNRGVDL